VTVDTQNTESIARAVLQLPDNPGWGIRTEGISVEGSLDGTTFSPILASRPVTFDAVNAHNTATLTFPATTVRYVRFTISSNTGWTAAQLAEVHLYAFGQGPSANGDFAQGKPVTATETGYGDAANLTDSNRDSIWEGVPGSYPVSVTVDTQAVQSVGRVVLALPSCACWGVRTQTIDIAGSTDGTTFTSLADARPVTFDGPNADNTAQVTFPATDARWIRVTVHDNSGSGAAQLAEVHVYAASANLALGNPATATGTRYGSASQLTDGGAETLWEGPTGVYPTSATIDLQAPYSVGRAVLQLPSCACWGSRVQHIDLQGSTDGTTWTPLLAAQAVTFDAVNAANTATLTFPAAAVRWVKVTVHDNAGSDAAQLAEVALYAS
jgi:archaellin